MLFKKFTVFKWRKPLELDNFQDFLEALSTYKHKPIHRLQRRQEGFSPILPDSQAFVEWFSSDAVELNQIDTLPLHELGGPRDMMLLMYWAEEKVILGPYVRRKQAEEVQRMTQSMGRFVTRGEREEVKDAIIARLLPNAQTRMVQIPILFTGTGLVLVGAHGKAADEACNRLRSVISDLLPIALAVPEKPVEWVLTEMAKAELKFQTGESNVDPSEVYGKFRLTKDFQIEGADGYRCRALGLEFDQKIEELMEDARISHASVSYDSLTDFKLSPDGKVSSVAFHHLAEDLGEEGDRRTDLYVELTHTVELATAVFETMLGGFKHGVEYDDKSQGPMVCRHYVERPKEEHYSANGTRITYEDED